MAYKVRFRGMGNINIWRVVMKVIVTLVALWGGGIAMDAIGDSINGTSSPFYQGLSIIGYTVSATNQITATDGSGILAIVGIFAMIAIISEFVSVSKY